MGHVRELQSFEQWHRSEMGLVQIQPVPYVFYYMGLFCGGAAGLFTNCAGMRVQVFTSDRSLLAGVA